MSRPCVQEPQPGALSREELDAIRAERRGATDEVLRAHTGRIVAECLAALPGARAILLYGSYGRGEGAWYRDEDGHFTPYNDYDVLVVSDQPFPPGGVAEIKQRLLGELRVRWLDIDRKSPAELAQLRPSILHHDLKVASRVIHGDPAVLDLVPEMPAGSLPMKEAQVLYFTRLWTLLGSLGAGGLDAGVAGEDARFFRNQMCKAVLAVVDVMLLAKGAYDASYCTRVERFASLHPEDPALLELSRWALQEKLLPSAPEMTAAEVRAIYEDVARHYRTRMYEALSLRFGSRIEGPEDVERALRWRPDSLLRRAFWLARFRDRRMEKRLEIQLAQSYLVAAAGGAERAPARLDRARQLLRSLEPALPSGLSWDDARVAAARLRLEL